MDYAILQRGEPDTGPFLSFAAMPQFVGYQGHRELATNGLNWSKMNRSGHARYRTRPPDLLLYPSFFFRRHCNLDVVHFTLTTSSGFQV